DGDCSQLNTTAFPGVSFLAQTAVSQPGKVSSVMRSNQELVKALRAAPGPWMDTAIVVAFENRFEFVSEDHPDPMNRLNCLEKQGGLAIGLAGVQPSEFADRDLMVQVF